MSIDNATTAAPATERELFINNEFVPNSTGEYVEVVDPATEKVFGRAAVASVADVDKAVAAARAAFDHGPWPRMTMQERAEILNRWTDELDKDVEAVTRLLVQETGIPVGQSQGGANTMQGITRYYTSLAADFPLVEERKGFTATASIEKVPVGVVAAIIPWNSPLGLAAFKLPQAMLAGCTVVMKPSEDTPLSAGYLGDAAVRAGIPEGVLNIVPALPEASAHLVSHPGVDKVSFTGSTAVGRSIAAGAAPTLKQLTLELGGKSAAVVLDDAPLDRLVYTMVPGVTNNNGAMCTVPSRLIVPAARHDEIVGALAEAFGTLKVGDPNAADTQVGPMITQRHYERVLEFLKSAEQEGGSFAVGGGKAPGLDEGYYVSPTIITGVKSSARVAQEEIFGPVLTVLTYETEEEAIALANDTEYGLNGAVFSADVDHALSVARRLDAGTVSINNGITIDITVPFGGFKQSGYGRELGPEGLDGYFHTKSVFLDGEPLITLS
ncbi:MAG: Aldehyde dehydrogenase [uncultured Arthrobacter sp.]|uniref:Aldehyde dehydrogenase n=1 Tax=uncultured Arthrobacter sp. TaxID=114050 RepID=A0A6J4JAX5_9MICC|nr:aldehyde dehydrogenase [uncultured Arthrobacter sp.]CAA9272524.1 MAG: Aldehyde dehydrogenase [uncultured Arthrobacter sp.]